MTEQAKIELEIERCAFCGALGVKSIYKDKLFGKGMEAVIIENLPVRHCDACSENYYDPAVSFLIDEILDLMTLKKASQG